MDIDDILQRAIDEGASDVHLKVGRPPLLRRNGVLAPIEAARLLGGADLDAALHRVCATSPARLERFLDTGDLDTAYTGPSGVRFRVNAFRQRGEISFAFRLIPRTVPSLAELGLPKGVERLADEHHGLVIVTGPTGVGKSTTLASVVDRINRSRDAHIVTIEDPIEFVHDDQRCVVNQREVGLDTASFRQALRQALRQDPDIILIGELRDSESAETALQAAESGHLVLATMHTIDAAETVGRMIEFFPPVKQGQVRSIMANVLRGVVSQRLLPRRGGGRVPAVEVMVMTARIADLIREGRTEMVADAIADGSFFDMQTFLDSLVGLVVDGVVDREDAATAALNRHDFDVAVEQALKRREVEQAPAPEGGALAVEGLRLRTVGQA